MAPRLTMFATTFCQSSRERRVETTTLRPWHGAHIRSTTVFPVPSGKRGTLCATANEIERCRAAITLQPRRLPEATAAHQINGKSAEPMRSLIMLACDAAAQPGFAKFAGEGQKLCPSAVA